MKTFFTNLFVSLRRRMGRPENSGARKIPDPLEQFLLVRREQRTLRTPKLNRPALPFPTTLLPR